jgi:osmoprotectant transport system substrate-binding protein
VGWRCSNRIRITPSGRLWRRGAVVLALVSIAALPGAVAAAGASGATVLRLSAASDCPTNPNCAPGLRATYGVDVSSVLVRTADTGFALEALDDGLAQVAIVFSSNPDAARPDLLTLRDDRGMIGPDHIAPIVRGSLLRRYARFAADIRRRLDAASRLITTPALRALNLQARDGRIPEALGGEFVDANGLGGRARQKPGPVIVVGYQDFDENHILAWIYANALRAGGYRVAVRSVGGLRPAAVRAITAGRIQLYPGYAGSLMEFLEGGRAGKGTPFQRLQRQLARRGLVALPFTPGQDRNTFVMTRALATSLGISKLSDLRRFWPRA